MGKHSSGATLTEYEKTIISALLKIEYTNQDIQHYINIGREKTINPARIAEVKAGDSISAAELVGSWHRQKIEEFLYKKQNHDYKTGLNPVDDARLIYAREAICAAVGVFNNPCVLFKAESFCVLANIAWTYLMHEFYDRKGVSLKRKDGKTKTLSDLVKRGDCPLSAGIKDNLNSLKKLRDEIEHELPDIRIQNRYNTLFQACCLNFDKMIRNFFGERLSLQNELSIALQFAKHDIEGIANLQNYDIAPELQALDAHVYEGLSQEQLNDLEYQFKVVYIKQAAPKGSADMAVKFISEDSETGKKISNVLIKSEVSDALYPFKPETVCQEVRKAAGCKYSVYQHTQAWQKHKIRPRGNTLPKKGEVQGKYCHYDKAHSDYLYNQAWIDLLIEEEKAKSAKP